MTNAIPNRIAIESGDQAVVVDTPFGKLGLAVCYDLRFPELFRTMLDQGMDLIALPSAFTAITGSAHWSHWCAPARLKTCAM